MDSDINLKTWACLLGFEGSDDQAFCELWKKLVPPSTKDIWRHITSHVLPARKADYIRKHCLLYKLELQGRINKEIKLQANVNSLKEYEKLMKIENAEVNLAYLNVQIEGVSHDIQKLSSKLRSVCLKQNETKDKEKEKLNKCKLIETKIKSVKKAMNGLKEMSIIVDNFIQTRPIDTVMKNDSRWDKEVVQFCKTLPNGEEIDKLCELLDSCIPTTQSQKVVCNEKRENKDKILQEMVFMLCDKYYEAEVHLNNMKSKMKKIDLLKQSIIQRFEEHHNVGNQSEQLNMIFDLNIKEIFDTTEANYLINLKNSWDNRNIIKSKQYMILKSNISSLEEEMERKRNAIALLMFEQKKLITNCINAQRAIIAEPKNVISDLKSNYKLFTDKINDLNFFTKEIKLFLNVNELRKADFNDSRTIVPNCSLSESTRILEKYHALMMYLKFALPDADKMVFNISSVQEYDDNELKTKLKLLLNSIAQAVSDIHKLKSAIAVNIEYCKTQPLAEGSHTSSEEYLMWRARYEEALKDKHIIDIKIEEDED